MIQRLGEALVLRTWPFLEADLLVSLFTREHGRIKGVARHALERSRANPDIGLSFDGTHVTLHAANGRWIWKLTGRSRCHRYGPDAELLVMVEGIWPD